VFLRNKKGGPEAAFELSLYLHYLKLEGVDVTRWRGIYLAWIEGVAEISVGWGA